MLQMHAPVVALMRDVARNVVMPRYQNLASSEISEKADADDLVTIAEPEFREGGWGFGPRTRIKRLDR